MSYADDFPPEPTPPFEELLDHVGGKPFCFPLNTRNTFIELITTIACRKPVFTSQDILTYKPGCKAGRRGIFGVAAVGKKFCNTSMISADFVDAKQWSGRNCKVIPASTTTKGKPARRCSISFGSDFVEAKTTNCRYNKIALFTSNKGRKACHTVMLRPEEDVNARGFRRLCFITPTTTPTTKWQCKSLPKSVHGFNPFLGSKRPHKCVILPTINYSTYLSTYVCKQYGMGGDVPRDRGATTYLKRFSCRLTGLFTVTAPGVKGRCGNIFLSDRDVKGATITTGMKCRIGKFVMQTGQRFRCGTVLLTKAEFKVYGRVWGSTWNLDNSTFDDPYVKAFFDSRFIRQSGRMNGRIRN